MKVRSRNARTRKKIHVAGEALRVPAKAVASVEYEREGGTQELEFQLKWTTR
ncbi:MAG: hypothetical protein WAW79_08145 [Steroidobacteraceae bacterium]